MRRMKSKDKEKNVEWIIKKKYILRNEDGWAIRVWNDEIWIKAREVRKWVIDELNFVGMDDKVKWTGNSRWIEWEIGGELVDKRNG